MKLPVRSVSLNETTNPRMDVAYSNAERLILTELNAVETRASADAMKAADFEYYQFVATLDRRTCPICGERDGEVYPLSSMNQGENAPPMHPRCRCTIVASIDDGKQGRKTTDQRAAEGRTRVPADMSYRDWQAVYVDKSKTLAQWQAEQATTQKENLPARNYNSVIAQKFGKMHYDNIRDILENAENKKAAQVWTKIEDQIQIDPLPLKKALQAYHRGGVVHINIDYEEHDRRYMAPYQAVFHEVGHFIDWLKSQIVSGKREYFSLRYEQNAFVKAIDKDFDALVAAKKAEIQKSRLARIDELKTLIARRDWNEMWIQGFCTTRDSFELEFYFNREPDKAQRGLARILKGTVDNDTALKAIAKDFMTAYPDLRDRVDWGDIFNGYTKGEYDVGIAHKKSYWKGDPNTRPKEAFAEFFSAAIANPKSYAVLKKHLPTAEKFFCDMLDELLAGL